VTPCDLDTSVPDWVIEHPDTLTVFQQLGIDYCCGGKSLGYAVGSGDWMPKWS
jgi:iron-sulfur cluster repair protein YtfE (RIC family)